MRNHRGFTLIELLVVLVIMLVVTGGIFKLLNTTQRLSRAQTERVDLQSNVRTAVLVVPSELREISTYVGGGTDRNDITDQQPTSITYRAMRGIGFICDAPSATEIRLWRTTWSGYRDPKEARDSLYVFIENEEDLTSDDAWQAGGIIGVSTGNNCPDGKPAITLKLQGLGIAPQPAGTPVRTFELMQLSLYPADGKFWLGAKSLGASDPGPQPLLGPLTATGLKLKYLDANGAETATKADVKSIYLSVQGETSRQVSSRGANMDYRLLRDSLVSQVSLRNAFRP